MDDEILDLVNADDEVIGTINRNEADRLVTEKLGFIRAVDMFIVNDDGKLWIPTRTPDKRIAPNGLDYSVGGHVDSGEGYLEALMREAEEEINTQLLPNKLIYATKMPPAETPYFRAIYIYNMNDAPVYNPADFVSADWLSPTEILEKIDSGVATKISIKPTILKLIELGFIK